jgi:hypothetical protein
MAAAFTARREARRPRIYPSDARTSADPGDIPASKTSRAFPRCSTGASAGAVLEEQRRGGFGDRLARG